MAQDTGPNIVFKVVSYLASMKVSRIIMLAFVGFVVVPFIVHYYLSKVEKNVSYIHHSKSTLDIFNDLSSSKAEDLKFRIQEMYRIKASVGNELRNLEAKSQQLQNEISLYHQKIDQLKMDIIKQQSDLTRLKISVQQAQLSHLEVVQHNSPELAPPLQILASEIPSIVQPSRLSECHRVADCFDFSRCSLTSGFPVYLYDPDDYLQNQDTSLYLRTLVRQTVNFNPHFTDDPKIACVYVVLVGESEFHFEQFSKQLPYWGGDGRNHILLNLSRKWLDKTSGVRPSVSTGKAMIAQSAWNLSEFRTRHDLVIPPVLGPPGGEIWKDLPYMLPARRKYLLSFQGSARPNNQAADNRFDTFHIRYIHEHLTLATNDEFFMEFDCGANTGKAEWQLCRGEKERAALLRESTFTLIPAADGDLIVTPVILTRMYEALKYGAVPLVLGEKLELPFSETIDWKRAVISIPFPRITECHWLLRSVPDNDLLLMRRQGRLLYEKYFATGQNILDTILAVIRNRLSIPPLPISDEPSPSIFTKDFTPLKTDPAIAEAETEENLGPLEPPYNSLKFRRNFTIIHTQNYELWNDWGDPFKLYPYIPFDPLLPSDAKFVGSEIGFRTINGGAGGAGKEFCESLGGNIQKEQFTIVILTYERDQVLMNSLNRLHGLPYLNKVIVIWNSPTPPGADLKWPDIAVPIHVVAGRKNSLNNRFLPYEAIETEAVLSVDDDAHLRHDEIIFGFRVWREQRDRVVGFPGRYHALDLNYGGWLYNSNYSCELSMVLTGAAFIHKYYLYMYSYYLPQAIRDTVDEYMNCEDIAMNFLVSHITRKPPVKVTSRWTFRCPGCPVSLSEDETHFNERHKCINFFTKVFGYTPLLNTQFRADSILFKTRIPHDKQKCFKFI